MLVDFLPLFIDRVNQESSKILRNTTNRKSVRILTRSSVLEVCLFFINQKQIDERDLFAEGASSTTRVLLFMTIPGQLTFVFFIWRLANDHARLSIIFIILYLCAALIQVRILYEINLWRIALTRLQYFSTSLNGWSLSSGGMNVIQIMYAFRI